MTSFHDDAENEMKMSLTFEKDADRKSFIYQNRTKRE